MMFTFGVTELIFVAAVAATGVASSWAAYRSFNTSVLNDFIGDRQLIQLLRRKHLLNEFARGAIHCVVCGDVLRIENLRLVSHDGRQLSFTCGRLRCTSQMIADQARLLDAGAAG